MSSTATLNDLPAPQRRCVFVYGTLRRGDVRDINRLHPAPEFIGEGVVAGRLFHLGSYPGIVLGGEVTVHGEVYAVTAELERLLDEIEEVWPQNTGEYTKRDVVVTLKAPSAARTMTCFLYEVVTDRTHGKLLIEEGDWIRHCARSTP